MVPQPYLPILNKVVFVDWQGVLSHDPFWVSILRGRAHPLRWKLHGAVSRLFHDNKELVAKWMRGAVTAQDVVDVVRVPLDRRFSPRYLERKLFTDCKDMRVNDALATILRDVMQSAFVVVATDNMDCFYEQVLYWQARRPRRAAGSGPASRLSDVARSFDDVLCSSNLGVLKREDPNRFFGTWLVSHQLQFSDAMLLDDLEVNCRAFRDAGGAATQILPTDREDNFKRVRQELDLWACHGS